MMVTDREARLKVVRLTREMIYTTEQARPDLVGEAVLATPVETLVTYVDLDTTTMLSIRGVYQRVKDALGL